MAQVEATFELGTNGVNVATTDVPCVNKWDATIFAGTLIYDNTHVAHGNLAMKANGKSIAWNATSLGTITDHYGRLYFYTGVSSEFIRILSGGINGTQLIVFNSSASTGFLNILDTTGNLNGTIDLRNKWIRLEYHIVHSLTVGQITVNIYSYDAVYPLETITASNRNNGASADTIRYGSSVGDVWFDDIVANATNFPGPYPTGPGPGPSQRATVQTSSGVSW